MGLNVFQEVIGEYASEEFILIRATPEETRNQSGYTVDERS